jgi:2-polyprenyl-6-methoxyphenol hydroxylase-like FAD-dependent oxidoreductase
VRPAKALIAGAGIGGLAAGIALRRAGLEVQVFERTPRLREIGAALSIWPNGSRSLLALGVKARALTVRQLSVRTWRGRHLMEAPVDAMRERYGCDMTFVHRADLQAALLNAFGQEGLRLDAEVIGFADEANQVNVMLRNGTSAEGDLLVGADGLRSAVRRQLLGDGDPVYLGSTVWRGMVSANGMPVDAGHGLNWFGRGSEFLAFHLADDHIYWAGVTKEPEGGRPGPAGHKQDLLERFADWQAPVPRLIAATPDEAILRNDMYDRLPAPCWRVGRVTLLGDAAHPMTPNQGQGACQALQDAVVLGESLAAAPGVGEAFELYEQRRLRQANRVVTMSRQATRGVQVENAVLCGVRDAGIKLLPRGVLLRMLDTTMLDRAMPARPIRDDGIGGRC